MSRSFLDLDTMSFLDEDLRGMFKNNVDFCYKRLSGQHRLIQTIPFRFGNRMGSENKIFVLILFILMVHGLFLLACLRAPLAVQ